MSAFQKALPAYSQFVGLLRRVIAEIKGLAYMIKRSHRFLILTGNGFVMSLGKIGTRHRRSFGSHCKRKSIRRRPSFMVFSVIRLSAEIELSFCRDDGHEILRVSPSAHPPNKI